MIKDLLHALPDESACMELISRFEPLLMKYAVRLDREDAYEDLRLFFIELIYKMKSSEVSDKTDGHIVNYIATSVCNHYIHLSKAQKLQSAILFSDLSEKQMVFIESISSHSFNDGISDFFLANTGLKPKELHILYAYYVECKPIKEIAKHYNVSRQSINQIKLRAINKLRKSLTK